MQIFRIFMISVSAIILSCSGTKFRGENSQTNPPTIVDVPPVNCTNLTHDECKKLRDEAKAKQSFRDVDCAGKTKAECDQLAQEAKNKDGDLNSKINIKNCDASCQSSVQVPINQTLTATYSRIGINFEDLWDRPKTSSDPKALLNDADYDDVVMCSDGPLLYDKETTSVISPKKQSLMFRIYSDSSCTSTVTVKIVSSTGKVLKTQLLDSKSKRQIQLDFEENSKLEVSILPYEGPCTPKEVTMHDAAAAIVSPDVCKEKVQ